MGCGGSGGSEGDAGRQKKKKKRQEDVSVDLGTLCADVLGGGVDEERAPLVGSTAAGPLPAQSPPEDRGGPRGGHWGDLQRMEELQDELFFAEQAIDTGGCIRTCRGGCIVCDVLANSVVDFMSPFPRDGGGWDGSNTADLSFTAPVAAPCAKEGVRIPPVPSTANAAPAVPRKVPQSLLLPTSAAPRALEFSSTSISSNMRPRLTASSSSPLGGGKGPHPARGPRGGDVSTLERGDRHFSLGEALYLTLFMGELRSDLVELLTLVRMHICLS